MSQNHITSSLPSVKQTERKNKNITFTKTVWAFYQSNKRSFPWRDSKDPYAILVSEFMLQQTQADRVIPKYEAFIHKFSTIKKLAKAEERDVLALWSGLGYNRRALYLLSTAKKIVADYRGIVPKDPVVLETFPGIGPYTARAIVTFSYDIPLVFIETNIRSVFVYSFFAKRKIPVSDAEIAPFVTQTLPLKRSREWYYALMDYGAHLKKTKKTNNSQHAIFKKQKPFKGSLREVRGAVMRLLLLKKTGIPLQSLVSGTTFPKDNIQKVLIALVKEGLVKKKGLVYSL
jgi:A/G-specific adenine glycosylase